MADIYFERVDSKHVLGCHYLPLKFLPMQSLLTHDLEKGTHVNEKDGVHVIHTYMHMYGTVVTE